MDDSDTRPSIACYRKDSFRITSVARHWQALEMFVTYTVTEPEDQYYDCSISGSDDESQSWDDGYHVNEDIRYAVSQFSHQHRTFLFSLHITNTLPRSSGHVRFCRWDRAGIVSTKPFDYGRKPQLLAEFFVRYNRLSAARRGFDTTAAPATQAESQLLADAIKEHLGKIKAEVVPPMHYLHLTLDKDYPTYKIHLPEIGLFNSLEVIVRRPISQEEVLVGKCTRGYVGFLLEEDRLVFVKDYWASIDEQDHYVMSEVDACHHTRLHKIPHLPNIQHVAYVTTGDSTPQTTETPELSHSYDKISRRQHIRIVQDLVYNIQAVRNSKQLVQAIRDVLVGELHPVSVLVLKAI
ncbi:hypothetical protein PHLCEN_2v2351 [Hermanssonia centrifuga]|uniref:Fungal-type protein kinase domain-containing protein n=1 Tax=Hermanssonia centrifuga TaxID=98765 RepID=A0A2R6RM75_9APHY|nr:hypothetical protein PHLCEN_2v2351 [Hermanssonia centrifuga]